MQAKQAEKIGTTNFA